jgi:hypothetical protein
MSDVAKIVKPVTSFITQLGAGAITSQIIKRNVQPTGKITAITIPVAGFFIGGLVANAASKHAEQFVDEVDEAVTNAYNEFNR